MVRAGVVPLGHRIKDKAGRKMQNFVIAGKAKTVFRLIELKAKQEGAKGGKNSNGKRS